MEYYINLKRRKVNNAWSKDPKDIAEICRNRGMIGFDMPVYPKERPAIYRKSWVIITSLYYWTKLSGILKRDDVVLYQHPLYGVHIIGFMVRRLKKRKNCKFIAVIHDLDSIRKKSTGFRSHKFDYSDGELLKLFDAIVSHNKFMTQHLVGQGLDESKIVNLGIFDYLGAGWHKQSSKKEELSIAIAGNLAKSRYIYSICGEHGEYNKDLIVHLYGDGLDESKANHNMVYHGSFDAEELQDNLEGDFGLVWDGDSAETCDGNMGEYLKYNNPHKTSCYLSAGMPVIVWSKSAIADFVLENQVGIVIDSLFEIEKKISEIQQEEYNVMCNNVRQVANKQINGYYFNEAIKAAEKLIYEGGKLLTISIAAYNVEQYIEKTISSCLSEKINDFIEVLVIDDGATDGTVQIAKQFENQYPETVRVIRKENGGYGSTINTAISLAEGKYFKQLDGDDWFDIYGLMLLLYDLQRVDADMFWNPYIKVFSKDGRKQLCDDLSGNETGKYMLNEICDIAKAMRMHSIAFKTEILRNMDLRITEHCFYTDIEYILYPLKDIKTVFISHNPVYCYRVGMAEQSMSIQGIRKHYNDHEIVLNSILKLYEDVQSNKSDCTDIIYYILKRECINHYRYLCVLSINKKNKMRVIKLDSRLKKSPEIYKEIESQSKVVYGLRKTRFLAYPLVCLLTRMKRKIAL